MAHTKPASTPPLLDPLVQKAKEQHRVVLCGSFRRDQSQLRNDHADFNRLGCEVLSPRDVDFVGEVSGFVLAEDELGGQPGEIETRHLRAMEEADLVWLHCPEGYVGRSAAMELGFAHALGLRVFARTLPTDIALADLVQLVPSPAVALETVAAASGQAPSRSIVALQRYYDRMAQIRGWDQETPEQTLSLLSGEVAELAAALSQGEDGASGDTIGDAALELADIQLYVVHMANVLGVDLGTAVAAKEEINERRFRQRRQEAA